MALALRGFEYARGWMRVSLCLLMIVAIGRAAPVKIFFDTDMMTDCDDAGAMAVLHALADNGECEILATVVSARDPWSAAAVDAINTYYGRPDLPIGMVKGAGVLEKSKFTKRIGEDFPNDYKTPGVEIPDATAVYRDVLEKQPDGSVVVVTVGYMTNLRNLLRLPATDGHPSGVDLIKRKVKTWVCMGGNFIGDPPKDDLKLGNVNFQRDATSAFEVIRDWPRPLVFVGREIGSVPSGLAIGESLVKTPKDNPVRMAYFHYFGAQKSRHVADLTTLLYAVRGLRDYWDIQTKGRMDLHENMTFEWKPGEDVGQAYLLKRKVDGQPNDRVIERVLDELLIQPPRQKSAAAGTFEIQLDRVHRGYDGKTCWVHPRAGAIPGAAPSVVLTMQKLLLTGSDVFYALNEMRSDDFGKTWSGPREHGETLGRRSEADGVIVATCDFTPKWHAKSGKLLGIGQTVRYRNDKVIHERDRETSYSVYDAVAKTWTPWTALVMPDPMKFQSAGAGSVQRFDLPNGDVLLPIYFKNKQQKQYSTTVLRCGFDGNKLTYREQGSEHSVPIDRGLYEPSITRFQERFFLTMRNDRAGYVAASADGLHFDEPRKWLWDDGTELGNYNTQQHWVTHSDALYLVYTRTGANNDHVFRHRAPLFIAQVDPERLCVLRNTEKVLIPERGARLGNFGVVDVNENETWVTVAEWMQTWGPKIVIPPDNPYGADNSVYAARIRWSQPNRGWNQR
jgi:hypothetical protein